jgi:hypothetical protein
MPKVRVRAYRRKDGTWVRSHWRGAGGAGGAVIVAIAVGGLTLGGSGTAVKAGSNAGRAPVGKVKVSAEAQVGFNRAKAALEASGHKAVLKMDLGTDCAAHSYGRVHTFFRSNPCTSLSRAYIQIGDSELLVAISWVQMPDASSAASYKRLVDTPGAGDVTELSRETTLYKNIKYTDSAHTSGIHGTAVWNVQVQPVFPRPPEVVDKILADSRQ